MKRINRKKEVQANQIRNAKNLPQDQPQPINSDAKAVNTCV